MFSRDLSSAGQRWLGLIIIVVMLAAFAGPALAQDAAPGVEPARACSAFTEAEQQTYDELLAKKDASTLEGDDLLRYDRLAQQLTCYNAQFEAPPGTRVGAPEQRETPNITKTVGAGGDYATLKAAFDDINNGTLTGAIELDVIGDTTETAPAALNASGSGSASYTSLLIQPLGGAGRTISGAITAGSPLIDFNGADNVTVDGLNTGGNSLTIANTTASGTSGTSTIRFIGGATNNLITNSTILGSFSATVGTNGGNIFFSTDANTPNGNDNNTISNNNIGPSGANLPTKGVYLNGSTSTSAIYNSGIVISGNNIYDYFGAAVTSAGVYISGGTTDITVSNNKFYQTATRTQTTGAQHSAVWVANTSGNNYQVTGNTIGYASSAGSGTYTFVGVSSSALVPIYLNVGTTTASGVQGNTIAGLSMTTASSGTSSSAPLRLIYVAAGLVNVGNVSGNTLGSQIGTGSISFSSSSSSTSDVYGIYNFGSSNAVYSNNTIGSVSLSNSTTGSVAFFGIRNFTTTSATTTMSNNTLGGSTSGSVTNNATGTASRLVGIQTDSSSPSMTGNLIRNMTMSAANTGTTSSASVIGINQLATTTAGASLSQNTVHSLANTNATAAVTVIGLRYNGPTSTPNLVARNFIHSLSVSSNAVSAALSGIQVGSGTTTYQNNMIRLGIDASGAAIPNGVTINGIEETTGTDNFYFNSVYIGGSGVGTGTANTYAFNSVVTVNTRAFQDNIFFNARSNATTGGKHYAVKVGGSSPNPSGLTINYNIYYVSGTGGVFGFFNSLDVASLAAWQSAVGQDVNSIFADPAYNTPAGTAATVDLHLGNSPTPAEGVGLLIASVTDDFDGQTRSGLTPTDIGADAGNFTALDPVPPAIGYAPLANTASTANRAFGNVTITDFSGVNTAPGTKPRVYYKRSTDGNVWNDNTSGTDGWKYAEANGTSSPFDFTIDYSLLNGGSGVSMGSIVQYFVVAQDMAGTPNVGINSGTFAAAPASVALTAAAFPIGGTIRSYSVLAISGSYSVGTSCGGTYATLSAAIADLNAGELTGPATYLLCDPLYTTPAETFPIAINANPGSSAGNTITIKPAPSVVSTISGSSTSAIIQLNGADYVIIDGSNSGTNSRDLTINNTSTAATTAVVWIASTGTGSGATYNTIKNLNLAAGADQSTGTNLTFGIFVGGSAVNLLGADNDYNTYQNNAVTKARYGIVSAGISSSNPNQSTTISGNLIGPAAFGVNEIGRGGIVVFNETGTQITGNEVRFVGGNYVNNPGGSVDRVGIALGTDASWTPTAAFLTNATVTGNLVHDIVEEKTYSAAGIVLAGTDGANPTSNVVANNMIYNILANGTSPDQTVGIGIAAGNGDKVVYNSIYLAGDTDPNASATTPTINNFAVSVSGASNLTLKNNIGYMNLTSSSAPTLKNAAINVATAFAWGTGGMNYNDWTFNPANPQGNVGCVGTSTACTTYRSTLAAWQGDVTPQDAQSISADPLFVSTSNLHISTASISPVANAGTPVAGVTMDYDGDTRDASYPDIGADEFAVSGTLPGGTYGSRAVNSGETWTLGGDSTLNGTLALNGGLVNLGTYTLTLGSSASVAGSFGPTSMIVADGTGSVCKDYTSTGSFTFPIGDNTGGADYSPATINYTGGTFPGNACVRVTDAAHPNKPASAGNYLTRYWTASGTVTSPAYDATFTYTAGDLVGTEGSMSGKKWDGAFPWMTLGGASGSQFTGSGLSGFSDFTAFDTPLAATLADLSAVPLPDAVRVTWQSVSEIDTVGYNVWRGLSPQGPETQINGALIPSQGPGSSQGFFYSFDDHDVISGVTYYYWVEIVDTQGGSNQVGPVSATYHAPTAVTLAGVEAVSTGPGMLPLLVSIGLLLAGIALRSRRAQRPVGRPR